MITYKTGNIFDEESDAIVNPVNSVGISGAGFALEIKNRYPDIYKQYRKECVEKNEYYPGYVKAYLDKSGKVIINFTTKDHWKGKSNIEWINSGLIRLTLIINNGQYNKIVMPKIGAGLGGLNWHEVKRCIERRLYDLECEIMVFI